MIRGLLDLVPDWIVDMKARHHARLRMKCGTNADFIDDCIQLVGEIEAAKTVVPPDPLFGVTLFSKLNDNILARFARSRITGAEAVALLYIGHCFLFENDTNLLLQSLIRWNELPVVRSDGFFVALVPEPVLDVGITRMSRSQWMIDMSYGFRCLLAEATVLFWEIINGRCAGPVRPNILRTTPEGSFPVLYRYSIRGYPMKTWPSRVC